MATTNIQHSRGVMPFHDDGGEAQRRRVQIEQESHASSREDCKIKIAIMYQRQNRKSELQSAITELNAELEKAVADHYNACTPAQEAIRKIDKLEVDAMLAGKTLNPAKAGHRMELRDQIDVSNSGLEAVAARIRPKLQLLEEELASPELDTTPLTALQLALKTEFADPVKKARLAELMNCQRVILPVAREIEETIGGLRRSIEFAKEDTYYATTEMVPVELYQQRIKRFQLQRELFGKFCLIPLTKEIERVEREIREE